MIVLQHVGNKNNKNGIGLIFLLSNFILQNQFQYLPAISSVECFSSMSTATYSSSTTTSTTTTRGTNINYILTRRQQQRTMVFSLNSLSKIVSSSSATVNTYNNNHFLTERFSALEMIRSDVYYGDYIDKSRNEESDDEDDEEEGDDEDFIIFEEQLRNDNPEKRIVMERNKQRATNGVSQSQLGDPDPSVSSSTTDIHNINDDNNNHAVDDTMLSDEQTEALNYITKGHNVFVTGVAGTGKSLVLKKALEYIQNNYDSKEFVAVAPTGSTAIALEGQTMHSFAGIGIPKIYTDFSRTKSNKKTAKRWQDLKILVLDEVSMVSGEFFDSLSKVVSEIRKDPRPFGGIQLVVCGDFLQLSPIAPRKGEIEQMMFAIQEKENLNSPNDARDWLFLNRGFCFQSLAWKESNFEVVELQHVFRQSNRDFVRILQNIRIANVNKETVQYLKDKCERPLPPNEFGIRPTVLHSKNVNVARENLIDLNKLPGSPVAYTALDQVEVEKGAGSWVKQQLQSSSFFTSCLAEQDLQLKIGAQVMLIKNLNQYSRLANGSRGKVIGFRSVKSSSSDANLLPGVKKYPVVQFKNGLQQVITPQKFQSRLLGMGICTRTAIPLKLAWAITTHKAQGLTLDYIIADVGQVFAEAQLYVALSRASDESGLELRNFSKHRVKANPLALQFHQDPKQQYPYWWDADDSKPMIMAATVDTKKNMSTTMTRSNRPNNGDQLSSTEVFDTYNLQKRTVVELKGMLRERRMRVSGKKAELIKRLISRCQ